MQLCGSLARKGNAASCSEAAQAFLQSELEDFRPHIRDHLDDWALSRFDPGTKLTVRLPQIVVRPSESRVDGGRTIYYGKLGAQEMPMYPSNYKIPWRIECQEVTLLLNVYVDDLTLRGDMRCHYTFSGRGFDKL